MTYLFRSGARYIFQYINPILFDTVAVNEFPKSGGTWVCKVLSSYLGYRFDDNVFPKYGAAVVKYHKLRIPTALKEVAIIRDPRDVIISFYYHSFFVFADNPFNAPIVSLSRRTFSYSDYLDIEANISDFIDYMLGKPIKPGFRWDYFYEKKSKNSIPIFRYEDLRSKPQETFSHILETIGFNNIETERLSKSIEKFNIKKIQKNTPSSEGKVNFVRSGKINGWQDILSETDNKKISNTFSSIMEEFTYR